MSPHTFPDTETLSARLSAILGGAAPETVTVLGREPSLYTSTFPSEVVTCRLDGGPTLKLFCKYAAGMDHNVYGHRGGVAYEADVYRRVLRPRGAATPRFYGSFDAGTAGSDCLIVEYISEGLRVGKADDPAAMELAARWIGAFHAANGARPGGGPPAMLRVYDAAYYRGWARRTARFVAPEAGRHAWLAPLCARFEGALDPLLGPPTTVIHGEFYPRNILYRDGTVFPVDWESAAVGAGEIDLATLTDGWPAEVVRACEAEYCRARWPEGRPASFERSLGTAQLYLLLRWLGDRPEWTAGAGPEMFQRLRQAGEDLALI